MRSTFTPRQAALAVACAFALSFVSATATAQVVDLNEKALLVDARGAPVMSSNGLCWHTAYGPAPEWTSGCHPYVATPVAQYVTPAAPAAQPKPIVVAVAAPLPVYEKVAFDANVLFDSDRSELRPAGRATLDAFVDKIGGLEARSILAIGYADRMGSDASNQILSEERVATVKAYLVSKGVEQSRVQTRGRGESRPSTDAGECQDANTVKNVACMQSDRHVFIEISGTRLVQ